MYYIYSLFDSYSWLGTAIGLAALAFSIWMAVDCVRNRNDWYWLWIIFVFFGFGAVIYFFVNKWDSTSLEYVLWKRRNLQRHIEDLQGKIHHLDKAHHYAELGDAYREQKKWDQAQKAYEAALERDGEMLDAQAHLGYALLAQGRQRKRGRIWNRCSSKNPISSRAN